MAETKRAFELSPGDPLRLSFYGVMYDCFAGTRDGSFLKVDIPHDDEKTYRVLCWHELEFVDGRWQAMDTP